MTQFENESRNNFYFNLNFQNYEIKFSPSTDITTTDSSSPFSALVIEKVLFLVNDITEIIFQNLIQRNNSSESQFQLFGTIYLSLKEDEGREEIQTGLKTKKKHLLTEIYLNQSQKILMIRNVHPNFPIEFVYQWFNYVIPPPSAELTKSQQFYILDGIYLRKLNNSHHENKLRLVFNNFITNDEKIKYSTIPTLETGNIIDSLSSALVCYGELRSIPVILCLTVRETSYTIESAQAFEKILPQLNEFLEINDLTFTNSSAIHHQMIKKDQFLSRTSNMFI